MNTAIKKGCVNVVLAFEVEYNTDLSSPIVGLDEMQYLCKQAGLEWIDPNQYNRDNIPVVVVRGKL